MQLHIYEIPQPKDTTVTDVILISHHLCPYVQRAAIAFAEKGIPFEKRLIDLANKPDWFMKLSPTGKVPVLKTAAGAIFESAVILEYIEETTNHPLHPKAAFERARHRAWIEFGSTILNGIAGLYSAGDKTVFSEKTRHLRNLFETLETAVSDGPYFSGNSFSLVDAVYGPVFRYFDVFDEIDDFNILSHLPKVTSWRAHLHVRPSIQQAVAAEYCADLRAFIRRKESHLSSLLAGKDAVAQTSASSTPIATKTVCD